MDSLKFLRTYKRLCSSYIYCSDEGGCPLHNANVCIHGGSSEGILPDKMEATDMRVLIEKLEEFEKEHPEETLLTDFYKKYPNAPYNPDGSPEGTCPHNIGYCDGDASLCQSNRCRECWDRPLDEVNLYYPLTHVDKEVCEDET